MPAIASFAPEIPHLSAPFGDVGFPELSRNVPILPESSR